MKKEFNDYYKELKDNFTCSIPIKKWYDKFAPPTSSISPTAMFIFESGIPDTENFDRTRKEINTMLFVQVFKDNDMQNTLLQIFDELETFLNDNPRLGGVLMHRIKSFDIAYSEDGVSSGILTVILGLTI